MGGWIRLHRKITNWEWFKTPNMYHLFTYMVLCANHEDNNWQGISIKKGQLVSGIKSLSQSTGISAQSVRTCLNKLKSTGEITIQSTNKYSIITICNYATYQLQNTDANNQINNQPNKQLTSNQQSTNNKQEYKKEEKEETSLKENLIKENPNPKEGSKKIIPIPIDPERQKWIDLAKEYNQEQIEKYPDEAFRRKQWTWEMAKEYKEESDRQDIETQKWFDAEEAREREEKEAERDRNIPPLPSFEEWEAEVKSKRKSKNNDGDEIL